MYVQLNMFVYIQNNGIILVVFACGIKCRFIFFAAWDGLCFFGETVPSITHGGFCSPYFCFSDVMWHTAKYGDPFSEFVLCIYPPKVHTHSSEHTHARSSGQPVLRCLAQGNLSRGFKGGESAGLSLPPPTIPAGPRLELATFRLWVQLSTIRPRLPVERVHPRIYPR